MFSRRIGTITLGLFLMGGISLLAAPTKEEKEVDKYSKMLKSGKEKDKVTALKELGRLGAIQVNLTKPLVPEIVAALDDKDEKVRAQAALTIGVIDPEKRDEVVEKLIKMLKDEKEVETVKHAVADGLASMGSGAKEAVPALNDLASKAGKKDRVYKMAVQTINGKRK